MGTIEHYIRLCFAFHIHNKGQVRTTVSRISEVLFCTNRNTQFILEKLQRDGFIEWFPERGRGKQSLLIFNLSLKEAARDHVKSLLSQQKINEVITFIQENPFPTELQTSLFNEFQYQFGFHVQNNEDEILDVLKIPYHDRMATLDPIQVAIVHEAHIVTQVFDTLVRFNKEKQSIEPSLAHTFMNFAGGTRWLFHLRKGIHFHNGKPLTSEDVAYTINRAKTSEDATPANPLFSDIEKLVCLDLYTIEIILKRPNHLFLYTLSSFNASIIPADTPLDPMYPIGTGPFKITKHTEEVLILSAFDTYFQGRPYLDQVEMWFLNNERLFPVNYQLHNRELGRPLIQEPNAKSTPFLEQGCNYLIFNMKKPGPHQNSVVRECIKQIINKKEMVEDLRGNRYKPAESFLIERTKRLAGKSENVTPTAHKEINKPLVMAVFNFTEFLEDAYWLKRKCAECGIEIQLIEVPLEEVYEGKTLSKCDMIYAGETLDDNLELSLYLIYQSPLSLVRKAMNSSLTNKVDRMVDDVLSQNDQNARMDLFHKIEQFLIEENVIIFMYHSIEHQEHDNNLQGIDIKGFGLMDFSKLWVNKWLKEKNQ